MESDLREAQLKRAMAQAAQEVVALVDHSKFGNTYIASSVLPEEIDRLLVDQGLSDETYAALTTAGIPTEQI